MVFLMTIREATLDDVPRLVELGSKFINGSNYKKHIPIDLEKTTQSIETLISIPHGVVFVYEENGLITGMIGFLSSIQIFSNEPTVTEMFWFTDPNKRGSGIRLLKHSEKWARDQGAKRIFMIAPTKKVEKAYKRLDYQKLETFYIKEII